MRLILDVATDEYILAMRTAESLMEYPPAHKSIICSFEGGKSFFARRNQTSISVRSTHSV